VDLLKKIEYKKAHPDENPFLDPTAWSKYLDQKRDELIAFMADPKNK
jgi:hypothetical protein